MQTHNTMKKNLIAILGLLLLVLGANAQENNFQMTIKQTAQPNKVAIVVRPINNKTGQISSFQFALAYPTAIDNSATASITSLITNLSFPDAGKKITTESNGGTSYRTFIFVSEGTAASQSFVAGTEYTIAEVTFTGGPVGTFDIRAASYPDGGTTFQAYYYMAIGGTQVVNTPAQFYGAGAVNGTFETGYSYVPLSGVTLPVKFLSFYALKSEDNAKLNWTVEGDADNKYFEVERSTDGRVFKPLSKINALGNGRSVNTYEAVDQRLSGLGAANVYYRIKQTDINGNIVYSSIKNLATTRKSTPVQILPNPAKTTTKLVFDSDNAGKGTILVRDMQGKLVLQYNTTLVKGINQQEMNVSGLASGDYNVTVSGQGFTHLVKMSKIN